MGFACERAPEYRTLEDGTAWKLVAFGESRSPRDSVGWMRIDATVLQPESGDTLLHLRNKPFAESSDPLWQWLATRAPDDSLHLRFGHSNFFFDKMKPGDTLMAHVGLRSFRTAAELRDARQMEYRLLDTLLRGDTITTQYEEYHGIWFKQVSSRGDTLQVRKGKEVAIHYRGWHLDGTVFDDSRAASGLFLFVYGNEGQVLRGIEIALERMRRGEVAELILPSWFAFGKRGSADGRVAPYTPVLYRVEVIDVSRN